MKTTYNKRETAQRERAKNLAIYNEVAAIAREVFNLLTIEAGTYSAAAVATAIEKSAATWDAANDDYLSELVKIEIDGFSCRFPRGLVFNILNKMGTGYSITSAARVTFERTAEENDRRAADIETAAERQAQTEAQAQTAAEAAARAVEEKRARRRENDRRRIVAAYRKNIETATGRDFWDVNEKFAPAIYRGLTTANDDTAAPAADIETSETPAALVPDVAAAVLVPVAFVDVCETSANDDTAAPGFAAAPVPVAAPLHFWHTANDDTRRPAVVLDIETGDTPANDDTAAHGKINAVFRYILRAAAVVAAVLLLTFANDRPTIATARPAAADIETSETPAAPSIESTTANDGAPAVLVPADIETPAAPAAADIESTTANDGAPRRRSTRPRRRAVRAAKVAAPAADIESTTARDTTANDDTARALLLTVANDTTANDTARAIVAAPTLYESGEITETSDTAAAVVPAAADIESTTANDDTQTAATAADIETSDTAAPSIESTTANDDTANDGAPATTGTTTPAAPAAGCPAAVATPCPPAATVAPVAPIIL